ncbi:hypothetical protein [Streptomyces sp. CB03238]|uniref:hypothetical protein n=1 Tax=Streptomyces sp. CB03238 TaxID=1907777 RepID=UPI0015C43C19|nr:hypothetical protein [Streptomyces sp. CB03238]
MSDDALYDRYMKATAAHRAHRKTCPQCSPHARCTSGQRLYETFARIQDAYLARLRRS